MVIALFVDRVIADPLVLSIVPPLMTKAPVPIAEELFMLSVPDVRVVAPVYALAPERVKAPVPVFINDIAPVPARIMPE